MPHASLCTEEASVTVVTADESYEGLSMAAWGTPFVPSLSLECGETLGQTLPVAAAASDDRVTPASRPLQLFVINRLTATAANPQTTDHLKRAP